MATFSFALNIQAPVWTPADLASPAGWFKSDVGVTLSVNDVTQWADQSSAGNNLTPKAAGNRAYQTTGFVNSRHGQVVGGGGGWTDALMENVSLASALDRANISGGMICWPGGADTPLFGFGPTTKDFAIQAGATGVRAYLQVYNGSAYVDTGLLHQARRMWITWRNNGTALEVWSNHGHFTGAKLSSQTLTSMYLGSLIESNPAPTQFKELVLSAVALNDTDQGKLNTYLTNKAAT